MGQNTFFTLVMIANAFVMLFQLRALMQSSNTDYYHSFTQAVTKLTNPLVNVSAWRNIRAGSFFLAGFIVAAIISIAFWLVACVIFIQLPFTLGVVAGVLMFIKSFGYLLITLMLAQALTSWLPVTQSWSYLFGQITAPITRPVQKIIPPIGMIDISLMVILFGLYLLNGLIYKILYSINLVLGQLWALV